MDAEFWQYAVPGVTTATAAIVGGWLTSRGTNKRVDQAVKLSEPTGNGFAQEVRNGLKIIQDDQKLIQAEQNRQALHLARIDGVLSVLTGKSSTSTQEGSHNG